MNVSLPVGCKIMLPRAASIAECPVVKAEHWTRTGANQWRAHFIEDINAVFALESLGIEFPLALAYWGTVFGEIAAVTPPSSAASNS